MKSETTSASNWKVIRYGEVGKVTFPLAFSIVKGLTRDCIYLSCLSLLTQMIYTILHKKNFIFVLVMIITVLKYFETQVVNMITRLSRESHATVYEKFKPTPSIFEQSTSGTICQVIVLTPPMYQHSKEFSTQSGRATPRNLKHNKL